MACGYCLRYAGGDASSNRSVLHSRPSYFFLIGLFLAFAAQFQSAVCTAIMLRSRPSSFAVRVVSYNVLSSHLASPSHFTTLDPTHLEASNRLPLVLQKLDNEMDPSTIICLQEVSHDWAAAFHTWFANRGYHFVTGLYGKSFNGYMGVALAYPMSAYETVDMDISRLSDKRIDGWPVKSEPSLPTKAWQGVQSLLKIPLRAIGLEYPQQLDHWEISESRFNILVTATLRDKATGKVFCIGNYHMPCYYMAPMVMTIHSELAAKHVQGIASKHKVPYILAGDWNITPDSATYKLMTTATLDRADPSYPTPKNGMEWASTMEVMRSAYSELNGKEPDFTNYARIKEDDPFIDTLDYIFLSKEWKVTAVKQILHRDEAGGPFPNEQEPSDHVLISADLGL